MSKKLIPNSTQIPNVILDFLIPQLPPAEARCLLYISRRTYGFHKEKDRISFSQFIDGIKSKDDEQLDYGTGLSRPSVNEALKNLKKAGAIIIEESNIGNIYQINLHMDIDKVVKKVNQLRKLTSKVVKKLSPSSKDTLPISVKKLNLQKKGKQRDKTKYMQSEIAGQINEIFNLFYESINPTINFANKTSRSATETLIKKFGFDQITRMVKQTIAIQGKQYAPVVTTPYEFKEKLGKLHIYFKREKEQANKNKIEEV
ncbi:MAG: replication protein [Nanoarchaeota archaeon]|nr:replication protein [Nanoarchaeota archaeon]